MGSKDDYAKQEVAVCFSVLIELMTILGEFRENIVLTGGWIPYFFLTDKQSQHVGSLDIDIALDFQKISDDTYQTMLQTLEGKGYRRGHQPFIFFREINSANSIKTTVEIDLLAGEYSGTGKSRRTQKIQDVRARKARGCDLAFDHNRTIKLSGEMPDGSKNEVFIKIADAVAFITMKGMAMWDRYKEKDAYDIYFMIAHYPGGLIELQKIFKPAGKNKIVIEGLGKIRAKFKTIDSPGPVWAAKFLEIEGEDEKERIQRDAYERINMLLDSLGIDEFDGEMK